MKHTTVAWLGLALCLFLLACTFMSFLPSIYRPLATSTQDCSEPTIMPTGERFFHFSLESNIPQIIHAGDTLQLNFYVQDLLLAEGRICDGFLIVKIQTPRSLYNVEITIDGEIVHSTQCPRYCELTYTIPQTLSTGNHMLGINGHTFPITIAPE